MTIGAPARGSIGRLSTFAITVLGLSAFMLLGHRLWGFWLGGLFLLFVMKDLEIIHAQGRIRSSLRPTQSVREWRAKLIQMHHWYAATRDLSVSCWWLVYGLHWSVASRASSHLSAWLFVVPYVILATCWCVIKDKTHDVEETLWFGGRGQRARGR